MFQKILIANRGEIALRIICACKELGIATVAVYSEADRNSLHVRFADEAVCIGPPRSCRKLSEYSAGDQRRRNHQRGRDSSRLRISLRKRQLRRGLRSFADHLHRSDRRSACEIMGEKDRARREMAAAGLPTVPGSDGIVEGEEQLAKEAERIGYPLIIKASAGGGGRGMRVVRKQEELLAMYADGAQRSATGLRRPRRLPAKNSSSIRATSNFRCSAISTAK